MREPGKKHDFLVRWGVKKLNEGMDWYHIIAEMKRMHKKSLKEIKELVKQ